MSPIPSIDRGRAVPLLGMGVMYPSVGALERIGPDWDWIWLDAQHGDLDYRDVMSLIRAANLIGRPVLVRVPAHDAAWIGKVLDGGAAGVIIPMVESVAEAQALVRAAKFPPLGNRSYGGRRIIDCLGRGYYRTANQDTLLILQVESKEMVAKVGELVAIEGVDGIFLGPDDLLVRDGQDVDTPKNPASLGKQYETVVEACRRHGKLSMGHATTDASQAMARQYGYDLVIGGGDVAFLASGSKTAVGKLRAYLNTPALADESRGGCAPETVGRTLASLPAVSTS